MTYVLLDSDNIISVGKHAYYGTPITAWPKDKNGEKMHKSKVEYKNSAVKVKDELINETKKG